MTLTIKNIEYKVKYSIRAMFIFEKIAGKSFELKHLIDFYIFLYSTILANNPNCNLLYDEFIDLCDEDPTLMRKFQEYLTKTFKMQNQFLDEKESTDDVKKK